MCLAFFAPKYAQFDAKLLLLLVMMIMMMMMMMMMSFGPVLSLPMSLCAYVNLFLANVAMIL